MLRRAGAGAAAAEPPQLPRKHAESASIIQPKPRELGYPVPFDPRSGTWSAIAGTPRDRGRRAGHRARDVPRAAHVGFSSTADPGSAGARASQLRRSQSWQNIWSDSQISARLLMLLWRSAIRNWDIHGKTWCGFRQDFNDVCTPRRARAPTPVWVRRDILQDPCTGSSSVGRHRPPTRIGHQS
jgi:hypothetical protein